MFVGRGGLLLFAASGIKGKSIKIGEEVGRKTVCLARNRLERFEAICCSAERGVIG